MSDSIYKGCQAQAVRKGDDSLTAKMDVSLQRKLECGREVLSKDLVNCGNQIGTFSEVAKEQKGQEKSVNKKTK